MAANIERHEIEALFDGAANDLFRVRDNQPIAGWLVSFFDRHLKASD